ncbi:sigma-70 family RNA polymerase sigma factor [Azomonas macrocytogenes]|uniref:RNA polymerase sigma-70 factor (ECF subfamily) n=1 Tax=Azomonas macrocytogenes TaxID=69962 RepID=A0A839T3H1_AZOMA|nr:sigma-70 family RNA polymerase sigma factor [Azomonas macrocytogenes]MBB3103648.1 RNA polymerase sigma-70 factor (ECF subfamily) [Azomonas macrocytogenes]
MAQPPFQQTIHNLYSEHHGWLFAWLRRKLGCTQHAADLAQDTFVRILASRDAALGNLREPRAYLTTTARRLLIDHSRRKRIENAYLRELTLTAEALAGFQSPEQILATLEALEQITFVLDGLGEKPRQVFLLYFLDGLPQAEIGQRLDISERMVRKHLVHALLHCQQTLDV